MNFIYSCIDCGSEYPGDSVLYLCPKCSASESDSNHFMKGVLQVMYAKKDLSELAAKSDISAADFAPYPIPAPDAYPVGNTPLVHSPLLSRKYDMPSVRFKIEGANPSGSFKDRASQMVAAQAIAMGEKRVVVASTGNAGSAMACAGAAYGLDVILFVPASAPANKLMQSVLYGACVVPIEGTYDDAFALSIEYTDTYGCINRNTAYNPITVEGKKSFSIELFLQMGKKAPDVVYVPTGDGVILFGVYKGFHDLAEAGMIDHVPHLVAVQATGSAAIANSFHSGNETVLSSVHTLADSISVASPAAGTLAVHALQKSGGWAVTVTDEEILDAQMELVRDGGMFAEPAASAAWAGARKDRNRIADKFGPNPEITVILTGSGFKDMAVFTDRVKMPVSVAPNLNAAVTAIKSN